MICGEASAGCAAKTLRQDTPPRHSAKTLRQDTPPSHTAKPHRQVTPPNDTAKLSTASHPGSKPSACRIGVRRSIRRRPPTRSARPSSMRSLGNLSPSTTTPLESGGACRQIGAQRSTDWGGGLAVHDLKPEDSQSPLRPVVPAHSIDPDPEPQPQHIAVPRSSTPVFQIM